MLCDLVQLVPKTVTQAGVSVMDYSDMTALRGLQVCKSRWSCSTLLRHSSRAAGSVWVDHGLQESDIIDRLGRCTLG